MRNLLMIDLDNKKKETFFFIGLLLFSCIHSITLTLSLVVLTVYSFTNGISGCLKSLIFLSVRTILNTAIAAPFSSLNQYIKLFLIVICSFYIFFAPKKCNTVDRINRNNIILFLVLFCIEMSSGSILNGSYPLTSCFKIFLFGISFSAVTVAFSCTKDKEQYTQLVTKMLMTIVILSIPVYFLPQFMTINSSFQGMFNHPNMAGIMFALFLAYFINYDKFNSNYGVILIVTTIILIYFTNSRTGMISAFLAIILSIPIIRKSDKRYIYILGGICLLIFIIFNHAEIMQMINDFIFKGHEGDILYSREGQQEIFQVKFNAHKLLGSGFAVPFDPDLRDWSFNMSLQNEPGNIIWAILGDAGIFGIICFALLIGYILISGKNISMLVVPIVISFGEMVFFSANNMSILLYILIAAYTFNDDKRKVGYII